MIQYWGEERHQGTLPATVKALHMSPIREHVMYWYVSLYTLQNSYDWWASWGGSLCSISLINPKLSKESKKVRRLQEELARPWVVSTWCYHQLFGQRRRWESLINHSSSTRPSPEKVMDSGKIPYLKTCILWTGNQEITSRTPTASTQDKLQYELNLEHDGTLRPKSKLSKALHQHLLGTQQIVALP